MRYLLAISIAAAIAIGIGAGQQKKAAPKLTFKTKFGPVVYDHEAHAKREKDDCKVCHDKIWPQSATAPLNFKGGAMHKTAETAKSSCATCHHPGGKAFAVKGSCNKCHVKGKA